MALGKRLINTGAAAAAACSTDSVQAFGADSAFSSNIALYQLDSDGGITDFVPDTTLTYDGIAYNVTYASGHIGNAAVFNGSTSYIDTGISSLGANFSVSMWINEDALDSGGFFGNWNATSNDDMFWRTQSDGSLRINIDGTSNQYFGSAGDVTINNWHHIVVSFNSGTYEVYLDSNSLGTATTSNTVFNSGANFYIGDDNSASYFDGSIDQVRIFDKAISAEDVATLYAETTSTASNTNPFSEGAGVALYTMDYDASEASGYYDGTPTNVEFGVGGKINYGARFNGSSSYIDLGTSLLNSRSAFSVSTWVNFDNLNTQNFIFYTSESGTGGNVGFYDFGNGSIYFQSDASTSANRGYISNSGIYTTDEWVHIVMVFDGSATGNSNRLKAYIQGTERTLTYDGTIPSSTGTSTANSWIGGRSSTKFSGDIDQVRVFSKALSPDEVATLWNSGSGEIPCVYECTTDTVNYPTTNLAYYKLDNSAEDETGSYDGTESNIEYRFGRYGQAAVFNGSSSKITINNFATLSQVGLSFWVNMPDVTSQAGLITKYGSAREFSVYIFGGDLIANLYYNGDNGNAIIIDSTTYMSNNTWHHIAYTADGSNPPILWIDGEQVGTPQSSTNNSYINTSEPIVLGAFAGNSAYYYDGKIDQVRIYSTALTSSQVTELYEEKPCADTSNFKTVLYEGNGGTQYISNVGFDLDADNGGDGGLVWVKNRDFAVNHYLYDSIRGTGAAKALHSNTTDSETSASTYSVNGGVESFDANGFFAFKGSDGTYQGTNKSGQDYVAWVWRANGEAVNIGVNTITGSTPSIASDVSANTEAGFSIVKYTGNATAGSTVGHGLDNPPELIIAKNRDESQAWIVNADVIGKSNILTFSSGAKLSRPNQYYYDWDSDTITLASDIHINGLNDKIIAYCFHSVAGYSKIGSYSGGQALNTDNQIDFGFEPSFVMIKNVTAATGWLIIDSKRTNGFALFGNEPSTEADYSSVVTLSSSGLRFGSTNNNANASGNNYIYMAFK
jgi:hypothetical protein